MLVSLDASSIDLADPTIAKANKNPCYSRNGFDIQKEFIMTNHALETTVLNGTMVAPLRSNLVDSADPVVA